MNTEIAEHVHIDKDATTIWETLADLEGIPNWAVLISKASAQGTGVGARRQATLADGANISEIFTGWEDAKTMQYEITGDLPVDKVVSTWSLAADGAGTKVTYHAAFDVGSDMAGPVTEKLTGLAGFLLAALKTNVETGEVMAPPAA